jgi:hypothetical protein
MFIIKTIKIWWKISTKLLKQKKIPEYSVITPATSSASASTYSNNPIFICKKKIKSTIIKKKGGSITSLEIKILE